MKFSFLLTCMPAISLFLSSMCFEFWSSKNLCVSDGMRILSESSKKERDAFIPYRVFAQKLAIACDALSDGKKN